MKKAFKRLADQNLVLDQIGERLTSVSEAQVKTMFPHSPLSSERGTH